MLQFALTNICGVSFSSFAYNEYLVLCEYSLNASGSAMCDHVLYPINTDGAQLHWLFPKIVLAPLSTCYRRRRIAKLASTGRANLDRRGTSRGSAFLSLLW